MKSAAQNCACLLETGSFTVVVELQGQGLLPQEVEDQEEVRPAVHLVVGLQDQGALKAHQVRLAVPKVEAVKGNKIR